MWRRLSALALLVAVSASAWTPAAAQAPAELPPSDYAGREYVDSQGCAFHRAVLDGAVVWAPRVTRDRQPLCGLPPSLAPAVVVVVPAAEAPAEPVAREPRRAPVRVAARGWDGVPRGYKPAWDDGRLNPLRGPRTAEGGRQMAQVLDPFAVPMRPATEASRRKAGVAVSERTGSRGAPALWVQVGGFARAETAAAAAARLAALGLPAARQPAGGMVLILAGPFATPEAAAQALARSRAGGFPDAVLRR